MSALDREWAEGQLRRFIDGATLVDPPSTPGVVILGDHRDTLADHDELAAQVHVVEQILDRVVPKWQYKLMPDAKGRFQQQRTAAQRALTALERGEELRVRLGVGDGGLPIASNGPAPTTRVIERGPAAVAELSSTDQARKVFVVHGRNLPARNAMFEFLRSIGLQPIEFLQARSMTGKASPYLGEILTAAFDAAQAVVVLMTPDEYAYLKRPYAERDEETQAQSQARPNVLFEAGMAMGRDADRTVLVELGNMRPFSDVAGRHVLRMSNRTEQRQELADRLRDAGCAVDLSGTDWHRSGTFPDPDADVPPGPVGRRVPSTPSPALRVDARFQSSGSSSSAHRLQIINAGRIDLYDVSVELPEDVPIQLANPVVQPRLPAGKSYSVSVFKHWQAPGPDAFDVTIIGRDGDGTPFRETAFIDTAE